MKFQRLQSPAMLLLACLVSPTLIHATQLEPYTGHSKQPFKLADLKGQTHSLSDYRGKVVLINFWASWCIPCIDELPEMTQLKQQLDGQPFEILAINSGESKYSVTKFMKRIRYSLPVLLDSSRKIYKDWAIKVLPTSFLIDGEGRIRYRVHGNPGWEDDQTISLINKLIQQTVKSE